MVTESKSRSKVLKMPKKIGVDFAVLRVIFSMFFVLLFYPGFVLFADAHDKGGNGHSEKSVLMTKTVSSGSATRGSNVTYTVNIKNTVNRWIFVTGINDLLPEGFSYVPGSSNGAINYDPTISNNNRTLTWGAGLFLWKDQTASFSFTAQSSMDPGSYESYSSCWGYNLDPTTIGPTAQVQLTAPELALNKSVDKYNTEPGQTLTYTINYMNTGDGSATHLFILEDIPSDTEYVPGSANASGMTVQYSHDGGHSFDTEETLPITNLSFRKSDSLVPGGNGSVEFQVVVQ